MAGIRIPINVETKGAEAQLNAFGLAIDKNLVGAIGAGVTAFGTMVKAWDATLDRLRELAPVVRGFETLTESIGGASSTLNTMRSATFGLVSDFELMKSTNTALTLGIVNSQEEWAELAQGAIRLGRALGIDALTSIDSITIGMGRQSKMMLDNIGIVVNMQEAYADYAKQLGVTVGELSAVDRQTAFNIATTEALREKLEDLGAVQLNLADQLDISKNQARGFFDALILGITDIEKFKISTDETVGLLDQWQTKLEAIEGGMRLLANVLVAIATRDMEAFSAALERGGQDAEDLAFSMAQELEPGLKRITEGLADGSTAIADMFDDEKQQNIDDTFNEFFKGVSRTADLKNALFNLTETLGPAEFALEEFKEEFILLPPAIEPAQLAVESFTLAVLGLGEMTIDLSDVITGPRVEDIPDLTTFGSELTAFMETDLGQGAGLALSVGMGAALSGQSAVDSIFAGLTAGLTFAVNLLIPGLGTLVGPLLSALRSLMENAFATASVGEDLGRDLGVQISDGLADSISALADTVGDIFTAITLRLGDIIREVGITSSDMLLTFTARTRDLFSLLEMGFIDATQATSALNDQFALLLLANEQFGGVATEQLQELIDLAILFGITIDQELIDRFLGADGVVEAVKRAGDAFREMVEVARAAMEILGFAWKETVEDNLEEQIAAIKSLGLSAELEAKLIAAIIEEQRQKEADAHSDWKKDIRERGKVLGLTQSEIRELIRAQIRQQRRDERTAARQKIRDDKKDANAIVAQAKDTRAAILAVFKDTKITIPIDTIPGDLTGVVTAIFDGIMLKLEQAGAL